MLHLPTPARPVPPAMTFAQPQSPPAASAMTSGTMATQPGSRALPASRPTMQGLYLPTTGTSPCSAAMEPHQQAANFPPTQAYNGPGRVPARPPYYSTPFPNHEHPLRQSVQNPSLALQQPQATQALHQPQPPPPPPPPQLQSESVSSTSSPEDSSNVLGKRKRIIACFNCHKNKKKCSTGQPCTYCDRTGRKCEYPDTAPGKYRTNKLSTSRSRKRQETVRDFQAQVIADQMLPQNAQMFPQSSQMAPQNSQMPVCQGSLAPLITTIHEPIVITDSPPQSPQATPIEDNSPRQINPFVPTPQPLSSQSSPLQVASYLPPLEDNVPAPPQFPLHQLNSFMPLLNGVPLPLSPLSPPSHYMPAGGASVPDSSSVGIPEDMYFDLSLDLSGIPECIELGIPDGTELNIPELLEASNAAALDPTPRPEGTEKAPLISLAPLSPSPQSYSPTGPPAEMFPLGFPSFEPLTPKSPTDADPKVKFPDYNKVELAKILAESTNRTLEEGKEFADKLAEFLAAGPIGSGEWDVTEDGLAEAITESTNQDLEEGQFLADKFAELLEEEPMGAWDITEKEITEALEESAEQDWEVAKRLTDSLLGFPEAKQINPEQWNMALMLDQEEADMVIMFDPELWENVTTLDTEVEE